MNGSILNYVGVAIIAVIIALIDLRKLTHVRTIIVYIIFYLAGFTLAIMIMWNRNLPGPTLWLSSLIEPISNIVFTKD
ncbi:MAG: hypothetical protein ACE3L7_00965 [Candidatus Pristimantibacillus sp.]